MTERDAMTPNEWVVVLQQIVGNPEAGYGVSYSTDGERYAAKEDAVSHGFKSRESDDFNVAEVQGERIVSFWWMDQPCSDDIAEAQRQIFGGDDE